MLPLLLLLAFVYSAQAGMMGDPVTSILHTAFSGSWPDSSATVGAGVEFTRTEQFASGDMAVLTLDIAETSFTLTFINNLAPTTNNLTGSFNLGWMGLSSLTSLITLPMSRSQTARVVFPPTRLRACR